MTIPVAVPMRHDRESVRVCFYTCTSACMPLSVCPCVCVYALVPVAVFMTRAMSTAVVVAVVVSVVMGAAASAVVIVIVLRLGCSWAWAWVWAWACGSVCRLEKFVEGYDTMNGRARGQAMATTTTGPGMERGLCRTR